MNINNNFVACSRLKKGEVFISLLCSFLFCFFSFFIIRHSYFFFVFFCFFSKIFISWYLHCVVMIFFQLPRLLLYFLLKKGLGVFKFDTFFCVGKLITVFLYMCLRQHCYDYYIICLIWLSETVSTKRYTTDETGLTANRLNQYKYGEAPLGFRSFVGAVPNLWFQKVLCICLGEEFQPYI